MQEAATDSNHQNDGGDGEVPLVLVVNAAFHNGTQTAGGNQTVEQHGDAPHHWTGNGLDDGAELLDKGKDYSHNGGPTDDPHTVDLGDGHNADVLAVGGVGRSAPDGSPGGGQTVPQQGAVQAGILVEVLSHYPGGHQCVSQMLADGGQGHDDEGDDGNKTELGDGELGQPEPGGLLHYAKVNELVGRKNHSHNQGEQVAAH